MDGPRLRAAGLLLSRDRPQPSRRRPIPGPGGDLRRRRGRGPRRRASHALGPRLGSRGRRRRPPVRPRGRRRRVPARDQGPPRAEGPGRQGLHRPLCGPRRSRGGRRHHGRGPRRRPPGPARRTTSITPRSPTVLLGGVVGADDAEPRRMVRDHGPGPATLPRSLDAEPVRPLLRHHQPPGGAEGRSPGAPMSSSSSDRSTRRTPGPSRRWRGRPAVPGCSG